MSRNSESVVCCFVRKYLVWRHILSWLTNISTRWYQCSGGGGLVFCQIITQSAQICQNVNFQGGGGGVLPSQNSKCPDLPKFQFSGVGGWGWRFCQVKTQSAKICLNFNFQGGGGLDQISEQGVLPNLSTNSALPLSGTLCITDSLSHTTYVEINKCCFL